MGRCLPRREVLDVIQHVVEPFTAKLFAHLEVGPLGCLVDIALELVGRLEQCRNRLGVVICIEVGSVDGVSGRLERVAEFFANALAVFNCVVPKFGTTCWLEVAGNGNVTAE